MDTAQLKQEFEKASAKLDRLEALRNGATESYKGETDELAQEKSYWLGEKKKWGDALVAVSTQPGNDFVTRRWGHRVVCTWGGQVIFFCRRRVFSVSSRLTLTPCLVTLKPATCLFFFF